MELPKNIKTRLRLRVKLWERKIEKLKKGEAEYGASLSREELKDKETREKYATKMTAFKYAIFKMKQEVDTWNKMLKGDFSGLMPKGEGIPQGHTSALCPGRSVSTSAVSSSPLKPPEDLSP